MLVTLVGLGVPGWASAQVSARVYVANRQAATVSVIDARTATVVAPAIAVGNGPAAVVPTRDGRFAYVLNHDADSVSVIDGDTLAVIKTLALPAGSDLQTASLSADESELLVAGESVGKIFRIDVDTNTLKPAPFEIGPASGHFTLNGNDLFIGRPDGTLLETFLFDTTLQIHSYALPAAVNEITVNVFSVYVSHPGLTTLSRVHLDQLAAPVDLGFVPSQILIDRGTLFVAGGAAHVVRIIDAFTAATIDTIDVVREATRIAVSPDGKTLYVSHGPDDGVSVVDIATRAVSAPIAVGDLPGAIAVGPATIVNDGLNTGLTLTSAHDDLSTLGFFNYLPFASGGILRAPAAPFASLRLLKPVLLGGDGIVDTGDGTLELGGPSGAGRLVKRGAGTLDIDCDNAVATTTRTGRILVETGALTGCAEALDVVLNAGTTLAAYTSVFANVTAPAGSVIDLQSFGLRVKNTVTLAAGTTLRAHVLGELTAEGAALLNGATLELVMPATDDTFFRPPNGSAFTIATKAQGTFAGLGEGALLATSRGRLRLSYAGGDAHDDVTLTFVDVAPTIDRFDNITLFANFSRTLPFSVGDDLTAVGNLVVTAVSSNQAVIADGGLAIGGSGGQRTLTITPVPGALGTSTVRVRVSDGTFVSDSAFVVTVTNPTYFLSEGATGSFFDTDLLLANPNPVAAAVSISFLRENGGVIVQERTLPPTSRTTIRVADVAGLAEAAFSIRIISKSDLSIVAERTMRWDATGYGSHTEAAVPDPQRTWYFAEGSQGVFFSTYILLLNPDDGSTVFGGLPPVATITFFREGAAPVVKQFAMPFQSRVTIDVGAIPELADTSFGARVDCFPTCVAERVMYFGQPLFSGGTAAAGATAPAREWFLAEGATGSYFNTYVLMTNPDQEHDAHVTLTYLPASGEAITKPVTLAAGRRMTRDIASEDPALASAAVSTRVESDIPLVVERAQYWPTPIWYEGHASLGMTETRRHWGLAEGRVGGPNADQTYILLANPGDTAAAVTLTFLRSNGSPLEKTFMVPPTSRFNVAINGPDSAVPELADESFGVDIVSTQPIAVERSMYSNANGVTWAAGTNAAASRLP